MQALEGCELSNRWADQAGKHQIALVRFASVTNDRCKCWIDCHVIYHVGLLYLIRCCLELLRVHISRTEVIPET